MLGQLSMFAMDFIQAGGGAAPSFQLITQAALACHLLMHIALPMPSTAACSMQVHSETWYTPF